MSHDMRKKPAINVDRKKKKLMKNPIKTIDNHMPKITVKCDGYAYPLAFTGNFVIL